MLFLMAIVDTVLQKIRRQIHYRLIPNYHPGQPHQNVSILISNTNVVPALPNLGDMSIFLSIFQNRCPRPRSHFAMQKDSAETARQWYTEPFRVYLWSGDRDLFTLAFDAAISLLHRSNRLLALRVVEKWVSNENLEILAKCYRLDRFALSRGEDEEGDTNMGGFLGGMDRCVNS